MTCSNCAAKAGMPLFVDPSADRGDSEHEIPKTGSTGGSGSSNNKKKKRKKRFWIFLLIIAVIIVVGIIASNSNKSSGGYVPVTAEQTESDSDNQSTEEAVSVNNSYDEFLVDLDFTSKDNDIYIVSDQSGLSNTGEEYEKYIYSTEPYAMISYRLDGKYKSLSALWAICDESKNSQDKNKFEIYVDNKKVYASKEITAGDLPQEVNVDLNKGSLLTILFTDGYGAGELANIELHSDGTQGSQSDISVPMWLTDKEYLNKDVDVYIDEDSINKTNTDLPYSHYLYGRIDSETNEAQSITYYLDGKYSKLSGMWAIEQNSRNTDTKSKVLIYADDELVFESKTLTSGSEPQKFETDINNCTKLKITFKSGDGSAELGNLKIW